MKEYYVITVGEYDERDVVAVTDDKSKADTIAENLCAEDTIEVNVFTEDDADKYMRAVWQVRLKDNGRHVVSVSRCDCAEYHFPDKMFVKEGDATVTVVADTIDEAVEAAREKLRQKGNVK